MSFAHASASEWAHDHSLAADVRFGRLESVAFQAHPEVYRWFGVDGAAAAERTTRSSRRAGVRLLVWIVGIVGVVGMAAPIAAVAALGGDRFQFFRMDAATSVPLAGVLFGIGALTQLVVLVSWVVRGAKGDGFVTGIATVALIFSVFGLLSMPSTAEGDGYAGWEAWYLPVVACAVISLVSTVATFVRFRVREPETAAETPATIPTELATASATEAIRALPASEQDAIRADRDAALAILRERGLIDQATLERASATELGTLFRLDTATPD